MKIRIKKSWVIGTTQFNDIWKKRILRLKQFVIKHKVVLSLVIGLLLSYLSYNFVLENIIQLNAKVGESIIYENVEMIIDSYKIHKNTILGEEVVKERNKDNTLFILQCGLNSIPNNSKFGDDFEIKVQLNGIDYKTTKIMKSFNIYVSDNDNKPKSYKGGIFFVASVPKEIEQNKYKVKIKVNNVWYNIKLK